MKNWENNRMEEIGLVTPTPTVLGQQPVLTVKLHMYVDFKASKKNIKNIKYLQSDFNTMTCGHEFIKFFSS